MLILVTDALSKFNTVRLPWQPAGNKANCNSHVVHNTLRKVTDMFDCDIETIVTSVYGHFSSISANRRVDLQSFFVFVDLE